MNAKSMIHVYGPVPSRRLGRSLGIDLVPFKTCTYDCVYCQLGRTTNKTLVRQEYVSIEEVVSEVERKLAEGEKPDYISLAGSGEPTLNAGLGDLIGRIKGMTNIPVAVLTNGSLLWMSEVQDALMEADTVLPSLDAGDENLFRYVNRPHQDMVFDRMVDGLVAFTRRFSGEVWLEVLLLAGVNGMPLEAKKIAALVRRIGAARVQLNTASRPPAEDFAFPLSIDQMLALKGVFSGRVDIISENQMADAHVTTGVHPEDADILALLGRRPCTSLDVANGLGIHLTEAVKCIDALVKNGLVGEVRKEGQMFFVPINRSGVKGS